MTEKQIAVIKKSLADSGFHVSAELIEQMTSGVLAGLQRLYKKETLDEIEMTLRYRGGGMSTDYAALRAELLADIDERLAACGKATPGPWFFHCEDGKFHGIGSENPRCRIVFDGGNGDADDEFVVTSRNHRPDELKTLHGIIEQCDSKRNSIGAALLTYAARTLWAADSERLKRHGLEGK